jgi:hypothetical protein
MGILRRITDAIFGQKAQTARDPATAQPGELTAVSPDFQGKVSNRPTPATPSKRD